MDEVIEKHRAVENRAWSVSEDFAAECELPVFQQVVVGRGSQGCSRLGGEGVEVGVFVTVGVLVGVVVLVAVSVAVPLGVLV